jgi:site-specific DNA recombinase
MAKSMGIKTKPPEDASVIYARYSTEHQTEKSIEGQLRACKEYAERHGLTVIREYIDRSKSGTTTEKRENLKQMIADSKKGEFSKVLVFSLDRFSRNLRDYLNNTHYLRERGVTLRSVTEQIDDSYSGKILAVILMLNAEMYVENLARHIKKSQKEAALKGLYVGGTPPLGYLVNSNKEYVINEEEAVIVRKIFEMHSAGKSLNDIAEHLNIEGHRTKFSRDFTKSSLNDILNNVIYIGTYKYGSNRDADSDTDKPIVLERRIPPIISDELFKEAKRRLAINKENAGRNRANRNYMLSGLMICGLCSAKMQVNTRRGEYPYSSYHCPNAKKRECGNRKSIRRRFVERFVLDKIFRYLFATTSLESLTAKLNEYGKTRSDDYRISKTKTFNLIKKIRRTLKDKAVECRDFTPSYVKQVLVFEDRIGVSLNPGNSNAGK